MPLDLLPVPCHVLDPEGIIQSVNHEWLKTLGYIPREVLGQPFTDFIHPDEHQRFEEKFAAFKAAGEIHEVHFLIQHANGRYIEAEFQGKVAYAEDGSVARTFCTFRDLSRRRKTEEALHESEERFRSFAEDMPLMAIRLDGRLGVIFSNRAVQDFFGAPSRRMLGQKITDFVGKASRKRIEDQCNTLDPNYPVAVMEVRHRNRTRRRKTIRWIIRAIFDSRGQATEYHAIGEDITAHKEIERQLLKAREDALQASRAKSDFLASMSHEIRTPLNGIIGMSEYLSSQQLEETHEQSVALINQSGQMLLELINDILDFSKIEAGKLVLFYEQIDLKRELKNLVKMLNERAESKAISLHHKISLRHGMYSVDIARLKQVLINLVGNAIKFTPRGGKVSIRVKEVDDAQLEFVVEDNGMGILKEKQEKLFEPFVQADGSVNQKFGGTGLGLSICKRIVDAMQGTLSFTSEEGLGASFAVRIPCEPVVCERPEEQESPSEERRRIYRPARALIVDDQRSNTVVISRLLHHLGLQSDVVLSPEDALTAIQYKAPDILFLDLNMPGLSGIELCRSLIDIASARSTKEVYRVAYTASASVAIRDLCREEGFHDFLSKPVTLESLKLILDRHQEFRTVAPRAITQPSAGAA
jgi:PAS domain S-box-containing protein